MNNEFNNLNNGTNSESNYQNQLNQNNMEQQVISKPNVKKYVSSKKKDRNVALIMMAVMIVIYLLLFFTLYLPSAEQLKKSNNKSESPNNTTNNNYNNNSNNSSNNNSDINTNNDTTITYQGYKFFKLTGYTYEITSEYLKVTNTNAGIFIGINVINGSYSQFETLSDATLKTEFEKELSPESIKVNEVKKETVSGRKFVVADLEASGSKYIMFITKADDTHYISGVIVDSSSSATHSNLSYASMVLLGVSAAIK